jgi:hypothetical protein
MTVKNPFRRDDLRKQFDDVVRCYESQSKALFATTTSGRKVGRAGNSWAACFWAGYDGMTTGARVPTRNEISYPWYVAGKAVRAEKANV